jgi:excinuclease ABC subunit B
MARAARNENGRVILFAKKITDSMQYAINLTKERRKIQEEFNKKHNITPKTVARLLDKNLKLEEYDELAYKRDKLDRMPKSEKKKILDELNKRMKQSAKDLNFEEAIRLRDEIDKIKKL